MIKAPPCISSIEFEGDKSDIPLLSVQMQVKNDISLKLFVIVTWLLWANHSPGFSRHFWFLAGKWVLAGKSWTVIGSKQSHDNNQQNGAKNVRNFTKIFSFHRIKLLPNSLLNGYHFYHHLGCFWKSYTPRAMHSGYNFSRNIPSDDKNDTHLEVVRWRIISSSF